MAHILLVDDRSENRQSLRDLLARDGHEVRDVGDARDAVNVLRDWSADLVLSDVRMNGHGDGLTLLRTIRNERPRLPVILYTGFAQVGDAVLAIKLGAADYLEFPIDPERLLGAVRKAVDRRPAAVAFGSFAGSSRWPHDLVAGSSAMRAVLDWVARIAPTDLSVLLQGETGTGKELIARALHAGSDRRTRPFVAVNCGAIPESLFEAELFGYRKGAFTGALADKPGLVEEAHGGTLFLDEIGELPMLMQVRLLRFLEDGEMRRLGAIKTAYLDVRVIAATNRVLNDEIAHGRFRSDLFFRLNTAYCQVPPLRHRLDDLEVLVEFWLGRIAPRLGSRVRGVTPGALALLRARSWPGNIRELRNVLEHAVSLAEGDVVTELDLSGPLGCATAVSPAPLAEDAEHRQLIAALEKHRWRLGRTAASLGMSRSTLWRKLRRCGIHLHDPRS